MLGEGLEILMLRSCDGISDAGLKHFTVLKVLNVSGCLNVTDAPFAHFSSLTEVCIGGCHKSMILSDHFFSFLARLETLEVSNCVLSDSLILTP